MNKYARYASWLAKAIIAISAAINAVLYFKTLDNMYLAKFGAYGAVLLVFIVDDEMLELKERCDKLSEWVVRISDREHALAQSVSSLAAEQLDCKERVDNLIKTLNGDE